MMMGMYGFRRQQAVDNLTAQMGARMTPESLRGALKGMEQHADSVIGGAVETPGQQPSGGGGAAPQTIRALDDKGVLHEAPAGTPLPTGWKAQ